MGIRHACRRGLAPGARPRIGNSVAFQWKEGFAEGRQGPRNLFSGGEAEGTGEPERDDEERDDARNTADDVQHRYEIYFSLRLFIHPANPLGCEAAAL